VAAPGGAAAYSSKETFDFAPQRDAAAEFWYDLANGETGLRRSEGSTIH